MLVKTAFILLIIVWISIGYVLNRQRKKRIDNLKKFVADTQRQADILADKIENQLRQ